MNKAFIIHGTYGNPNENWFPWLKEELTKLDYEVISPTFPTPEEQSLENWDKVFEKYSDQLDEKTIMIGHSLGCPFILNVLQNIDTKIKGIYLVSGFHTLLDHPIDEINKTFVETGFDWKKIKNNCDRVVMFNGSDDKYIKRDIADELAKNLDAEYEVIKDGGHLNATAGYTKFEKLLESITSNLSKITNIKPEHRSIAILLPGFLDSNKYLKMKVFAENLNELGYATLRLDPCGLWYGNGTDDTYKVSAYIKGIEDSVQLMKTKIKNPKDVLLLGHSLGAFLAIVAGSKIGSVTSVCSLCPPSDLQGLAEKGNWKESGFKISTRTLIDNSEETRSFRLPYSFAEDAIQYSAIDSLKTLRARLMIGISLGDREVRVTNTEKLITFAKEPYVSRFEGMDHHFNRTLEDTNLVWDEIEKFLKSTN